jgi:hypothetical protein
VPRRSQPAVIPEFVDETAPLAIPAPRKEHEHRVDPYRSLPGAMPGPDQPKRRPGRPRKDDVEAIARREQQTKLARYDRYIDAVIALSGDQVTALATVFGIEVGEADQRFEELLADVQNGIPSSTVSEMLQRRDLSKAARLTILRKHAYSNNPAASLKALDMLKDIDGAGPDVGSYESFVRRATE